MNHFLQLFEARQDLKAMYDSFNRSFWADALPDIPVRWSRIKRALGLAKAELYGTWPKTEYADKFIRAEKKEGRYIRPTEVVITSLYDWDDETLKGIVLHEMAHIYFYVQGDPWEQHGAAFQAECARLEKASGITVPPTEEFDASRLAVHDAKPLPEAYILIVDFKQGGDHCILINKRADSDIISAFTDRVSRSPSINSCHGYFGSIDRSMVQLPIRRAVPKNIRAHGVPAGVHEFIRDTCTAI